MDPPFALDTQLYKDFPNSTAHNGGFSPEATLPGYPRVLLANQAWTASFIKQSLWAHDLESVSSNLWILSTQSGANINPLHRQKIKGREIIITEDPRLHLVWNFDRIFIKPLPRYLLSHEFWNLFLLETNARLGNHRDDVRKAAMGFLRTYYYLVQYESDFEIAQRDDVRLIPKEVTWMKFCQFITAFAEVQDHEVSGRFHYGELRLSRLNRYAPLLFGRRWYEQVHGQYAEYFAQLYGPLLFIFAIVTTILGAMQVVVAVDQAATHPWMQLWPFFRWFGFLAIFGTAVVAASFLAIWIWMFVDECVFAFKKRFSTKKALADVQ